MNDRVGLQNGLKRFLQLLEIGSVCRNIKRSSPQLSQGIDLVVDRGITFAPANPDYARLVVFHHEPRPHFAKTAGAADDDINPILPVAERLGFRQGWKIGELLKE